MTWGPPRSRRRFLARSRDECPCTYVARVPDDGPVAGADFLGVVTRDGAPCNHRSYSGCTFDGLFALVHDNSAADEVPHWDSFIQHRHKLGAPALIRHESAKHARLGVAFDPADKSKTPLGGCVISTPFSAQQGTARTGLA